VALGIGAGQVRYSYDLLLNGFVAEISAERAQEIASRPEVKSVVEFSTPSGLAMDAILPLINAPRAWELAPEGTAQGAGVKIGIIDSTLDSAHPAFQDPDLTAPEGFPKGNSAADLAKTSGKVIVYRTYNPFATTGNAPYHGTAVAMAAAGVRYESPIGMVSGVAPKAWIGFYALGDIETAAILKAMEDAVADGMDILNLSVAFLTFPDPSQMAPFEAAAERAMRLGVAVVWAAGNLGPERTTVISHSASDANLIVGGTRNSKISGGALRMPSGQVIPVIPSPGIPDSGEPIRGRLRDVRELDRETGGCVSLPAGSLEGRIALVDISVECAARVQNLVGAGAIAALGYIPGEPLGGFGPGNSLPVIPVAHIGAAEAAELIRTGASGAEAALDIARQPQPSDPSLPYQTSASGPTPDYKIRPDLAGAAQFVYSALPGNSNSTLSGTSYAAPQVSGGIALDGYVLDSGDPNM
jgi:subtilisin family serine protease